MVLDATTKEQSATRENVFRVCVKGSFSFFITLDVIFLEDTSTSEDQWWAGKCLIKGAGKSLPIGAYRNAWDCLDRCQGAQIQDNYTACEYSKAKGECQAYTGQVEHTTGEFIWSSKSLCYVFKKDGRCFRILKLSRQ